MSQPAHYFIVAGPSKWELMLALFDNSPGHSRTVEFTLVRNDRSPRETIAMSIVSIGRENGDGESWIINGTSSGFNSFSGYYHTRERNGQLKLITPMM